MKQIEKVTEYVSKLFDLYSMNDYGFFRNFDDDIEEVVETPLFPYGVLDDETLEKISINFGISKEEILSLAAAVERFSTHPIAESILAAYEKDVKTMTDALVATDVQEVAGHGVSGFIDSKQIFAGNYKLMKRNGILCDEYAGNGTVVHASSSKTGVITSKANYRQAAWAVRIIK